MVHPRIRTPHLGGARFLHRGYTLLEMLVVVGILAALGGAAIYAAGEMREQSLRQISMMEMQRIKKALLQYRQDTGALPSPSHPADFSALFEQPSSQPDWDPVSARGWRGPYLTRTGEGEVDVGDLLATDGSGSLTGVASAALAVLGVADPFVAPPVERGSYTPCDETPDNSPGATRGRCVLDWRAGVGQPTHVRWGRPYLLFDMPDPARARIVGLGPDGIYAGNHAADVCLPQGDDLVLCLQR